MDLINRSDRQIHQLARDGSHPEALVKLTTANQEFMAYIPLYEPGTLGYDVWQEQDHPTRFTHIIIIENQAAHEWHSISVVDRQIADIPVPECLAMVEFIGYRPTAR